MHRGAASRLLRRCTNMRPYSQQIHGQSFIKPFPRTLRTSTASTRSFSRTSTTCESKLPNIDSDTVVPASISIEQYHQISDEYMDAVVAKLEELQEAREDVDVEYSAGVLTLKFPPQGTYVLNKQPPNKQIWLSSPISGPKRYDYVILGDGQDTKEGTGVGDWIYLRDGSKLQDLLLQELGVHVNDL